MDRAFGELPMRDIAVGAFVLEVRLQSKFVSQASANLTAGLESGDVDAIWLAIHSLLAAAANLSKLFWPVAIAQTGRGDFLRDLFGVYDDSPLRSRALRNDFEHFDERLDAWTEGASSVFADRNIGPRDRVTLGDEPLRHYDPDTDTVYFRDSALPLTPLWYTADRLGHADAELDRILRPDWAADQAP
jgi:hypothetical protein